MSVELPVSGEVQVHRVDLDREEACSDVLSQEEIARADRFHFKRDARRWIVTRSLLRRTLGAYLDADPAQLQIDTSFWGKPGLPGCPLRFNVSHSGGAALFAFAWQQEVGIDIEHSRLDFNPADLAPQIYSAQEQAVLCGLPAEQQHQAFLTLWTAKEAYVKARGAGLSFPLTELTLTLIPETSQFQVQDLTQDSTRPAMSVRQLRFGAEHFAALALEGPIIRIKSLDCSYASTNQYHHPCVQR